MKQIGVIGGRKASRKQLKWAEEIGRFIAEYPAILLCGGLGGVMDSAARGARNAGGITVGILPGSDKTAANSGIGVRIATGMGLARNVIIVGSSDLVFAIGGSHGTLSEMAFALQFGIPVIGLETWNVDERVIKAENPQDAVKRARELLA